MEHLKNILAGMRQAFDLSPTPRGYSVPQRGDFSKDAERLHGDFAAVGRDMHRVLKRDGQQTNNRTR